jgi:hypothetical protein
MSPTTHRGWVQAWLTALGWPRQPALNLSDSPLDQGVHQPRPVGPHWIQLAIAVQWNRLVEPVADHRGRVGRHGVLLDAGFLQNAPNRRLLWPMRTTTRLHAERGLGWLPGSCAHVAMIFMSWGAVSNAEARCRALQRGSQHTTQECCRHTAATPAAVSAGCRPVGMHPAPGRRAPPHGFKK